MLDRLSNAGRKFLAEMLGSYWLDVSKSKRKTVAAHAIASVLWFMVCCYVFAYFFIASLPVVWDGGIVGYIGIVVFTLILLSCLVVLAALIAATLGAIRMNGARH